MIDYQWLTKHFFGAIQSLGKFPSGAKSKWGFSAQISLSTVDWPFCFTHGHAASRVL
jgi:hypothetical protein